MSNVCLDDEPVMVMSPPSTRPSALPPPVPNSPGFAPSPPKPDKPEFTQALLTVARADALLQSLQVRGAECVLSADEMI